MESLFKEGKKIVVSYTKCAKPFEIENEVVGYRHAESVGMQVADLLHYTEEYLTLEKVEGISCFRYLELLRLRGKGFSSRMQEMLIFLIEEVKRFQSVPIEAPVTSIMYEVEEKIATVANVMSMVGHPRADVIAARVPKIAELFAQFSDTPFRDATPKNSILSGVSKDNALTADIEDVIRAVRHIDFRSVGELVPYQDDYISVLYHYMVPEQMRSELLRESGIATDTLEFIVAKFVRIARFWGRRYFYFHKHPDMFLQRYDLEDMSFYDEQFDVSVEEILEATQ